MKKYVNISDMFCDIDADKMKTDYEAIRAVKDRISRSKKKLSQALVFCAEKQLTALAIRTLYPSSVWSRLQ